MPDSAVEEKIYEPFRESYTRFRKNMQELLEAKNSLNNYASRINSYLGDVFPGKLLVDHSQVSGLINVELPVFIDRSPYKFLLITSLMVEYYMENFSGKKIGKEEAKGMSNEELLGLYKKIIHDFYECKKMKSRVLRHLEENSNMPYKSYENISNIFSKFLGEEKDLRELFAKARYLGLLHLYSPKSFGKYPRPELLLPKTDILGQMNELEEKLRKKCTGVDDNNTNYFGSPSIENSGKVGESSPELPFSNAHAITESAVNLEEERSVLPLKEETALNKRTSLRRASKFTQPHFEKPKSLKAFFSSEPPVSDIISTVDRAVNAAEKESELPNVSKATATVGGFNNVAHCEVEEGLYKSFVTLYNSFVENMKILLKDQNLSTNYAKRINCYLSNVVKSKFTDCPVEKTGFLNIEALASRPNAYASYKFLLMISLMAEYYIENFLNKEVCATGSSEISQKSLTIEELLKWCKDITRIFHKHKDAQRAPGSRSDRAYEELVKIIKKEKNLIELILKLRFVGLSYLECPGGRKVVFDLLSPPLKPSIAERVGQLEEKLKNTDAAVGHDDVNYFELPQAESSIEIGESFSVLPSLNLNAEHIFNRGVRRNGKKSDLSGKGTTVGGGNRAKRQRYGKINLPDGAASAILSLPDPIPTIDSSFMEYADFSPGSGNALNTSAEACRSTYEFSSPTPGAGYPLGQSAGYEADQWELPDVNAGAAFGFSPFDFSLLPDDNEGEIGSSAGAASAATFLATDSLPASYFDSSSFTATYQLDFQTQLATCLPPLDVELIDFPSSELSDPNAKGDGRER